MITMFSLEVTLKSTSWGPKPNKELKVTSRPEWLKPEISISRILRKIHFKVQINLALGNGP